VRTTRAAGAHSIRDGKLSFRLGIAGLCLAAQGCASPDRTPTQTIRVETPGCAAARCQLSNDRGTWQVARTPGSVAVLVSGGPLRVSCSSDDDSLASTKAALTRPGTSGVGGAVGGVAGGAAVGVALGGAALAFIPPLGVAAVVTGALVGGAAGNAVESHSQELRYPALISVPMACQAAGQAVPPASGEPSRIGLTVRGLTPSEARDVGLEKRTAVLVVAAEGLAAASGLRGGDVLLALDGQDLADAADLEERLQDMAPAAPVTLRVVRDRRIVDVPLTRVVKEKP
jgi:uncharacterized protein YcfJ